MAEFLGFVLATALIGALLSFVPPLHGPVDLHRQAHRRSRSS
jgi:hypothetical protein